MKGPPLGLISHPGSQDGGIILPSWIPTPENINALSDPPLHRGRSSGLGPCRLHRDVACVSRRKPALGKGLAGLVYPALHQQRPSVARSFGLQCRTRTGQHSRWVRLPFAHALEDRLSNDVGEEVWSRAELQVATTPFKGAPAARFLRDARLC
jgi:hypothetical protein